MWLIGMMGSGKTTVGRETATRLRFRFYDTDAMVEEMSTMKISAIWAKVGEEGFRELERRVIDTIPHSGFVAAAGGGAVLSPENREHMSLAKHVVWLRSSPRRLAERLEDDGSRPLLESDASSEEKLRAILTERSELYTSLATDHVDTDDRNLDDVISDVVRIWRH